MFLFTLTDRAVLCACSILYKNRTCYDKKTIETTIIYLWDKQETGMGTGMEAVVEQVKEPQIQTLSRNFQMRCNNNLHIDFCNENV